MQRLILRDFSNGDRKPLKELGLESNCRIIHVWTILSEDILYNRFSPITGEKETVGLDDSILIHGHNVFLEDMGHDWNIVDGDKFKFNGQGKKGEKHDLLIEFERITF